MFALPTKIHPSGHPFFPDTFYLTGIQLKIFSLINQGVILLFPFEKHLTLPMSIVTGIQNFLVKTMTALIIKAPLTGEKVQFTH